MNEHQAIVDNEGLVRHIVSTFCEVHDMWPYYDDLCQAGRIGVLLAVRKPSEKCSLRTSIDRRIRWSMLDEARQLLPGPGHPAHRKAIVHVQLNDALDRAEDDGWFNRMALGEAVCQMSSTHQIAISYLLAGFNLREISRLMRISESWAGRITKGMTH